jgi:glycosyltransferase involved in cell wall biosynthesis
MNRPTLSCIIPVYNAAAYLAEALDSVFAQTVEPDEIIVVDDGSTDGSLDVAARYATRVKLVSQDNRGPASARNHGLRLAGGELVAFLDADDIWAPDKTARQCAALAELPEVGICITHVQNFWAPELQHEQVGLDQRYTDPHPGYVCQCLMARRTVFDRVGVFDESLRVSEDTDWFTRAERAGVAKHIVPDVLVHRRLHGSNTSYSLYNSDRARNDILEVAMRNLRSKRGTMASGQAPKPSRT